MIELERMAIILKAKAPFHQWVNSLNSEETIGLESLQKQATVILVPLFEEEWELDRYLSLCYQALFEQELSQWSLEQEDWPTIKSFGQFKHYFDIETHDLVLDMVQEVDEEYELVTLQ